jgi:hypothetical protein
MTHDTTHRRRQPPRPRRKQPPRRRGGQPGNTNALKHGLYSATLPPAAAAALDAARALPAADLTEEIAALRARLAALSPYQLAAWTAGIGLLCRLVAQQHRMSPAEAQNLADAVATTLRELGAVLYPQEGEP